MSHESDVAVLPPARKDRLALSVALLWLVATLGVSLWVFGSPHRTAFQFPDEIATARGAMLIEDGLVPRAAVPFHDPTGLARMRMWVTSDGAHIAAYPATAPYVYGLPRLLPGGGWLIFVLSPLGTALLAATATRVLKRERWLGALLPALAFPALYWLLRPWQNVSLELALVGGIAAAIVWFMRSGDKRVGMLVAALATGAAIVRPDHVLLLLVIPWLWTVVLSREDGAWRRWTAIYVIGGAVWVAGVVVGNLATTGAALTTPVDLLDFPSEISPAGRDLPFPWSQLLLIVAPRGWPDWGLVADQLGKYWFQWAWFAIVAATGLAGTGWLVWHAVRERTGMLTAAAVSMVMLLWHAASRVSATDLGAAALDAGLKHSYPRYTALVYLGLAAVTIWAVSLIRRRGARLAAAALLVVVAALGLVEVFTAPVDDEGLIALASSLREADDYLAAIDSQLPADAIVYSQRVDKYVWGARPVGKYQDERPPPGVAAVAFDRLPLSFQSALDAGYQPYLLELTPEFVAPLRAALEAVGLQLIDTGIDLPNVIGIPDPTVHRVARAA